MPKESLIKQYLDEIEADRKAGRATSAPSVLDPRNILGGRTKAFQEAVKRQGEMLKPKKKDDAGLADTDEHIFEKQSQLRNLVDRAKKAKNLQVR